MIQHGTKLRIVDNSGGKFGLCIKLLGYYRPNSTGKIGNIIVVIVKDIKHSLKKIKKHTIYYGLIVRTKKELFRRNGSFFYFFNNDIILLSKNKKPLGTRVIGLIPNEIRKIGWTRIISISEGVV